MKSTTRKIELARHGDCVTDAVRAIEVELALPEAAKLQLRYRIIGDTGKLRIARPGRPGRRDGLWQHTCFEVFIKGSGESYCELNFSPSRQWAAYSFEAYRRGMARIQVSSPPPIDVECHQDCFLLEVTVDVENLPGIEPGPTRVALAAVVENGDRSLSYWALAHPPGAADFHHVDGFVLALTDNDDCNMNMHRGT